MTKAKLDLHKCAMPGCDHKIPLRYLMCSWHWRLVPSLIKIEIYRLYVKGQEKNLELIQEGYFAAVQRAIQAVRAKLPGNPRELEQ